MVDVDSENLGEPLPRAEDLRHFQGRTRMIETHLDSLSGQLPIGGLAVDVGCGLGMGAIALANRGFASIGVDIDSSNRLLPFALTQARKSGLVANLTLTEEGLPLPLPNSRQVLLVHGDAADLQVADNSVDLVTAFYVSGPRSERDHWTDIAQRCLRVLKPGAPILITTEDGSREGLAKGMLRGLGFTSVSSEPIRTPGVLDTCVIIGRKPFAP